MLQHHKSSFGGWFFAIAVLAILTILAIFVGFGWLVLEVVKLIVNS